MSGNVTAPEGPLCVGRFYELSSDAGGSGPFTWRALTTPLGVLPSDVTFLGAGARDALVSVPVEGTYSFVIDCCDEA